MTIITQDETNPNVYKFSDKCTCNYLEFQISEDKKTTWINSHYLDSDNCKLFIIMLNYALQHMKSLGAIEYEQITDQNEWNDFLSENKEWEIVKTYPNTNDSKIPSIIDIKCNINVAYELIVDGFLRNNNVY